MGFSCDYSYLALGGMDLHVDGSLCRALTSLKNLIEPYIEAHRHSWSQTTQKSERSRLSSVAALRAGSPEQAYEAMRAAGWKPYTIKTAFLRLSALQKWSGQDLGYTQFLREMRNRFKHSYERKDVGLTYEEAESRIAQIPCEKARGMAMGMLKTGVRLHEAYQVRGGVVRGKGSKLRKVHGEVAQTVPRSTLWARLKAVGLKPHDLRKLCATRLADRGASAADLCKVFGWSSIQTAYQYLQAKSDEKIQEMMR